jgi:anti-sigma regulatory factor (Ser/Thr protein kinase)
MAWSSTFPPDLIPVQSPYLDELLGLAVIPTCNFEADKLILKLSVTLAADKNCVDPVVQGIMQLIRQMACAAEKEEAIQLALNEALANAVVHGAQADPSKVIECDVTCDESRGMLIVVRDPGKGFDPAKIPSPVTGQNLYADHGRGIYLINQLMDEVKFLKNGTEIQMIKR